MFAREEFVRMAKQLGKIEGRFLMSINDVPAIRETFAAFEGKRYRTTYTVAKQAGSRGARAELLIGNFEF